MTTIALLPSYAGTVPSTPGLHPLSNTIPAGWGPLPHAYAPAAMPTPYGRAETMRLVLQDVSQAGDHDYLKWFRWLLLGAASGVLSIEPHDLRAKEYDNLGRALLRVEPDARYFCQLRWKGPRGKGRVFGITHVRALFSPHARRTREEWSELANEIEGRRNDALTLLGEWRTALQRGARWEPRGGQFEWQRGIDHVLDGVALGANEGLEQLRDHCRLVGPVWISLPTGLPEIPSRLEPLYLPSFVRDHAASLSVLCHVKPTLDAERGAVRFIHGAATVGSVAAPPPGAEGNALALGAGIVTIDDVPRDVSPDEWVTSRGGQPGLFALLRPVVAALEEIGRPTDAASVASCPPLYPDSVRIPIERGLWPSATLGRLIFTRRVRAALLRRGGKALTIAQARDSGAQVTQLGVGGAQPMTVCLLDSLDGEATNDLRALGAVLWRVFVREAIVKNEKIVRRGAQAELLLVPSAEQPLEVPDAVYDEVAGKADETISRRLATLQRFAKAYANPNLGLPLLGAAAQSFASWASARGPVSPLGRRCEQQISMKLLTGDEIRLPVDAVES